MAAPSQIRTALFDLDGCLYPADNGLEEHCRARIASFMVEHLHCETEELARAIWAVVFRKYNQSLRGLRAAGYRFDEDAYWHHIRDAASLRLLSPAPGVRALLELLNAAGVRCFVFTNCREKEAREALEALQVPLSLFCGMVGADAQGTSCKPERAAFAAAFAAAGCEPESTVMFEDSLKNLATARALGLRTVLIGGVTAAEEGGDASWVDACVPECTLEALRASPAAVFLPLT